MPQPPQDHSDRIAEIRDILRAGISSHTVDGVSISYDFETLRRELRELEANDVANRTRKPRLSSINLGNF